MKAAYDVGKDNINNIMGKVPSKELIGEIKEIAATLALYVDVDPDLSLKESHKKHIKFKIN